MILKSVTEQDALILMWVPSIAPTIFGRLESGVNVAIDER